MPSAYTCPVCKTLHFVNKDGKLRKHRRFVKGRIIVCVGSGEVPIKEAA